VGLGSKFIFNDERMCKIKLVVIGDAFKGEIRESKKS
jgi:hypothetical protein